MIALFFFAFVSAAFAFAMCLEDINPYRPAALPMLEQIELCMARGTSKVSEMNGMPLAA